MKRPLLYTLFFLMAFSTFAQQAVRIPKVGLSVYITNPPDETNINRVLDNLSSIDIIQDKDQSFAAGILLKYRLEGLKVIRLRLKYASIVKRGFNNSSNSIVNDVQVNSESMTNFEQRQWGIIPGITWASNISFLRIHYGFELPLNYFGEGDFEQNLLSTRIDRDLQNNIRLNATNSIQSEATLPSGYSVGLGSLVGFTYQFNSHFEIGGEFAFQVNYENTVGQVVRTRESNQNITVQFGTDPPEVTEFSEIRVDEWETGTGGFDVGRIDALFFLNYWF